MPTKQQVVGSSPTLVTTRNFGRRGVGAGLKILTTWFDSTRFHSIAKGGLSSHRASQAALAIADLVYSTQLEARLAERLMPGALEKGFVAVVIVQRFHEVFSFL